MKKKKQQRRNLIIIAVVTVGIVLGLWAMKSKFSFNSNAAGANCYSGIYMKGGDKKCYEVQAQCGAKCCNKVVDNKNCKNSKFKPIGLKGQGEEKLGLTCEGSSFVWYDNLSKTQCILQRGKVCENNNEEPYCCNKKVALHFCQ